MLPGAPGPDEPARAVVEQFVFERWTNQRSIERNWYMLDRFVRDTGVERLSQLTPTVVLRWCTGVGSPKQLANNTIRGRAGVVLALLEWCAAEGVPAPSADVLRGPRSPLKQYRPTYGKAQSVHPPRWLTRDEAFVRLVGACDPSTEMGMRDELIIRLGLSGLRGQEIVGLTIGCIRDLHTDHPSLHWVGKGYKPLHISIGPQLAANLGRYLAFYARGLDRPLEATDPLLCVIRHGRVAKGVACKLDWGTSFAPGAYGRASIWRIITKTAERAGLGHVAPHDLRRTAAGLLHRDVGEDGSHRFDLLDIQKVLHHADPVTTMKCYLDPMDTEVLDRAAGVLD